MRPALLGALLLIACLPAVARADEGNEGLKDLRQEILRDLFADEDKSRTVAAAYQKLFTGLGLAGLPALMDDEDPSIALQAAWEVHRIPVKRNPPVIGRTDLIFDRKPMEEFLEVMAKRLKSDLPAWWSATLLNGDIFKEQHHAFLDKDKPPQPTATVRVEKKDVVITSGERSVRMPKAEFDQDTIKPDQDKPPVVLCEADLTFVARLRVRGYPFKVFGVDSTTGKRLWTANVWAARRGASTGPDGAIPVEIRRKGDMVIVYGAESHGMFAEGFDAKTGKCQFRFCTCYWFNHPEAWGLK